MRMTVPVIGILRGIAASSFESIMPASFEAGLEAIEVTINTDQAEKIVSENVGHVPEGKFLGMGTIRNLEEAKRAIGAGAMFLVTPNLDIAVIEYAKSNNVPVIAGALTPTEVYTAWSAGADMVKVFPCSALGGPEYIRELLGPFDRIPLVPVGGVRKSNLQEYFRAGVKAVGVGASLFGKEALREEKTQQVARNVKDFIDCCAKEIEKCLDLRSK